MISPMYAQPCVACEALRVFELRDAELQDAELRGAELKGPPRWDWTVRAESWAGSGRS